MITAYGIGKRKGHIGVAWKWAGEIRNTSEMVSMFPGNIATASNHLTGDPCVMVTDRDGNRHILVSGYSIVVYSWGKIPGSTAVEVLTKEQFDESWIEKKIK